jgi:hypothetical protein
LQRLLFIAVGLIAAAIGTPPSLAASGAATVEVIQGQVSINRGEGFKPAAGSIEARIGDLVMASPGGKARIVYSGGCAVDVHPGAVVAVQQGACTVAKPMMLGPACDPSRDDKCLAPVGPAVPGTPWYVYPAAAGLIVAATCVGWCPEKEHHVRHVVEKETPSSP